MDEFDDLENPEVTELLQRWGKSVRQTEVAAMNETPEPIATTQPFSPPDDLSALHQALDEVDGEIDASAAPVRNETLRVRWYVPVMAIAALILLVVGGWNMFYPTGKQPRLGGVVATITVSDLRLGVHGKRLRGGNQAQFRSGQALDIHVETDGAGFAVFAILDHRGVFSAVQSGGVFAIEQGTNTLDLQIRLDEQPGTESLVIIAAKTELELAKIDEIIARAQAAASATADHGGKLRGVLQSLRKQRGLGVTEFTFEHLP